MILHRLGERTEDDADLQQLGLERRCDGDGVEHRVDGDAAEALLFVERDAELLERRPQLRIDFIEGVELLLLLRRGVVARGLVIDRRVVHVRPGRLLHRQPVTEGLEAPLQHPVRLLFLRGDEPDDVFVEAEGSVVGFDVGDEAVLVLLPGDFLNFQIAHSFFISSRKRLKRPPDVSCRSRGSPFRHAPGRRA